MRTDEYTAIIFCIFVNNEMSKNFDFSSWALRVLTVITILQYMTLISVVYNYIPIFFAYWSQILCICIDLSLSGTKQISIQKSLLVYHFLFFLQLGLNHLWFLTKLDTDLISARSCSLLFGTFFSYLRHTRIHAKYFEYGVADYLLYFMFKCPQLLF